MKRFRFVSPGLALAFVGGLAWIVVACGGTWQPSDSANVANSEARQLACVAEAGTLAEARACWCKVRADYPGPQCDGGAQ